jgi:UPF0755 protein
LLQEITLKTLFKFTLLIAGLLASLSAFYVYHSLTSPLNMKGEGYVFELTRGASLNSLAGQLVSEGVLDNSLPFKLYGRITRVDKSLKAGEYYLEPNTNTFELFERLQRGATLQRSFTFVEGWSYRELFAALKEERTLTWNTDEAELRSLLNLSKDHFEGMFFADTYFFSKGQSVSELLIASNQKLHEVLEQEWSQREDNLPLANAYEALILASIVEKETGLASERPLIAGVFVNRLRKKMRLQTDPTVIYGIGESYNGNITKKHLQTYTPYNTYRIPALPPTPIAIVGRESIHAVMHPKKSDYLYFVAKGDGSHYFSPSFEEHQNAVKSYQWKRVNDYRSSPNK